MAIIRITCPDCAADSNVSFLGNDYQGPYTCWKCKSLFSVVIRKGEVDSLKPLNAEEMEAQKEELKRQAEIETLKNKFRKPS